MVLVAIGLLLSPLTVALAEPRTDLPPEWLNLPVFEAVEDIPLLVDLWANVSDPDTPKENLTVSSTSPYVAGVEGLNVTFLFPNDVLEATVEIDLSDGTNRISTWASFNVTPVNDPPRWVPVVLPDGMQDEFYSFNLTVVDEDNMPEELEFFDDSEMFQISSQGEIAFVPRNEYRGQNWFNVTVLDPGGLSDTMELSLYIDWHDIRILPYLQPQTAYEDEIWVLNLTWYLSDPDIPPKEVPNLTLSVDTGKIWVDQENLTLVWDRPTNEDVGDFYFKVNIVDGQGRYAEQEIKIEVFNTNDAPVIGPISVQGPIQDVPFSLEVPWHDDDMDVPGVDEVVTFSNDPEDLFIIGRETGLIELTPRNEHVGEWVVNITATDSAGASHSQMVTFVVLNVNEPPYLQSIGAQQLVEDEMFWYQVNATDADLVPRVVDGMKVDPEERLFYTTYPPRISIDPHTGLIGYTPTDDDAKAGQLRVLVTVEDTLGAYDIIETVFFVAHVWEAHDFDIIGLDDGMIVDNGKLYHIEARLLEIDSDPGDLSYTWYAGTTLIATEREFDWRPDGMGVTEVKLVVRSSEGWEVVVSTVVKIRMLNVSDPPTYPIAIALSIIAIIIVLTMVKLIVDSRRRKRSGPEG